MNRKITVSLVIALILAIGTVGFANATPRLLKECNMAYWTSSDPTLNGVAGNQVSGFKLTLNGDPNTWYYLNIKFLKTDLPEGVLPQGVYMFYLTVPSSADTTFWNYWAAKGVTATATPGTWQGIMWLIIHGAIIPGMGFYQLPMFGLYTDGNGYYELRDGFLHFLYYPGGISPLRVNGDYPCGSYTFTCTGATTITFPYSKLSVNALDSVSMTITFR